MLKRFAFLTGCDECVWYFGKLEDRSSGLVPGPSSYLETGYIILSPSESDRIRNAAAWTKAELADLKIEVPPTRTNDPLLLIEGEVLESKDLLDSVLATKAELAGRFVFIPSKRLVYYRFVID